MNLALQDAAELVEGIRHFFHQGDRVRLDAHDKIVAMGFAGSERTTRRAVTEIKTAWRSRRRRVHRPWIPPARIVGAVRLR